MMERKDLAMSFIVCDERMVMQNNCWNPCVGREEYSEKKRKKKKCFRHQKQHKQKDDLCLRKEYCIPDVLT